MTETTLRITRRSKIGFSWTNSPERWTDHRGESHLRIATPSDTPTDTGSVREVYAEFCHVARCNNSNDWSKRWFVRRDGEWVRVVLDPSELGELLFGGDPCGPKINFIDVEAV